MQTSDAPQHVGTGSLALVSEPAAVLSQQNVSCSRQSAAQNPACSGTTPDLQHAGTQLERCISLDAGAACQRSCQAHCQMQSSWAFLAPAMPTDPTYTQTEANAATPSHQGLLWRLCQTGRYLTCM